MIHALYTGSKTGTCLQSPLGQWLPTYAQQCFWKWQMPDSEHLMFKYAPTTPTRIGLQMQQHRNMLKFSPTIPTTLECRCPPVTPFDTTTSYIKLPVPPLPLDPAPPHSSISYSTLQSQFQQELIPWQCALFGSIQKAGPTNKLQHLLQEKQPVMIVSNASHLFKRMGKADLLGLLPMITSYCGMGLAWPPVQMMTLTLEELKLMAYLQ